MTEDGSIEWLTEDGEVILTEGGQPFLTESLMAAAHQAVSLCKAITRTLLRGLTNFKG